MNLNEKFPCDWNLIRFLDEKDLILTDDSYATISVTEPHRGELMIFFGKSDDGSSFEARIYKNKPSDRYIPHAMDKCSSFEENEEYATFFFGKYIDVKDFIVWLGHRHMEYVRRPKATVVK